MRAAKTSKAITVPLSIIAALLCIFALKTASSVLIPIVSAVFLYLIFVPVASWMDNAHVPRAVSTIAVLLVLTMVLLVVFYVLSMVITSIVTLLPDYYNKFQELDIMITTMLHERFNSEMFSGRSITSILNINWAGMLAGIIAKASNIAISLSKAIGLIFVYLLFLMFERGTFVKKIGKFYPDEQGRRISIVVRRIIREVERYLVIKTIMSLATGVCVGLLCYFVGYDLYFLAGLMAFSFNYIPSIGSIVVTILITALSAIQFLPDFVPVLIILGGTVLIEMIIGNLIDPKVSGDQLNISPFMILLSLAFWGYIWGVIGMLFSVPFLSIIKIISSHVKQLRFVELLIINPKDALSDDSYSKDKKKTIFDDENFVFGDEDEWSLPREHEDEDK